jgi:hypothetical protein
MSGVKIDSLKLQVKVSGYAAEAVYKAANRIALRARGSILGQGRIDTGDMINGFRILDVTINARRPTRRVINISKHFGYQELGTPKEAPGIGRIYPRRPGGVLRFRPKGSTLFIYARSVRGVRPGHFLKRAVEATRREDFL